MGHDSIFQPRAQVDAAGFVSTRRWLRNWQRTWSQVACGAGLAIGCFLLWRRFDGGLQRPLGWQALLTVGLSLIVTAATIRHFWTEDGIRSFLSGRRWLPTIVLLSIGLAVSLAGTNGLALFAFWALLLTSECLWLFRQQDGMVADAPGAHDVQVDTDEVGDTEFDPGEQHGDEPQDDDAVSESPDDQAGSTIAVPLAAGALTAPAFAESQEIASGGGEEGDVLQRLLRTRDANGQEVLFGELRADFAVGDRQTRLHVAFCPPLDKPPQVHAEATFVDEALGQVIVKVAQVLVLGTRIDVELDVPAETAGAVQVEFYAAVES